MGQQSSDLPLLRALVERQGVSPTDEDLEAVLAFLQAIMPALEELEALLPPEATV